ncbi:MAG: ATPase, T2SS/T4P/T4SS family [Candidatus Wildermuthbacteria bacterium]|nr:ATPase, T2SS/T4P/T4SS family [Candidatus Wildermuthbacteria bacterium]
MDLTQLLIQKGLLDKQKAQELEASANASHVSFEEVLLSQKVVDEETLFSLKSEALKVPLRTVAPEEISLKVLELIPEDSAKYYKMIPLAQRESVLEIGMVFPEDLAAKEALKFLARQGTFSYEISLITLSAFEGLLRQYKSLKGEMSSALEALQKEVHDGLASSGEAKSATLARLVEEAPITKMVAVILRTAVEGGASDIHIEPGKEQVRVRFRFLGDLHASLLLPQKVHQAVLSRVKILASMRIDETRIPQDGRFSAPIEGVNVDFRVSTFPTALGEKVAIRVLDPSKGLKKFADLGLSGPNLKKVEVAIRKPYGLILSTGPTGSGKTTTLYAVLQLLNKEGVNIVSIEDPVEYLVEGVNQSQVRPEIGYDFASGLRQILRQDPNVIMVGEVRDKETASLVIHAALTGHIVLSTLHTNNAIGVIPRLLDMGVDRYLIPSTLSLAIAQRLIRRLCDECKQKEKPTKAVFDLIAKEVAALNPEMLKHADPLIKQKDFEVYAARGCKACGTSGFRDRVAIFEILTMTDELEKITLEDPSEKKISQEAARQGMTTLRQDGILKVLDGVTTVEEVMRATEEV